MCLYIQSLTLLVWVISIHFILWLQSLTTLYYFSNCSSFDLVEFFQLSYFLILCVCNTCEWRRPCLRGLPQVQWVEEGSLWDSKIQRKLNIKIIVMAFFKPLAENLTKSNFSAIALLISWLEYKTSISFVLCQIVILFFDFVLVTSIMKYKGISKSSWKVHFMRKL